jgi:uncharacterized membrane protein
VPTSNPALHSTRRRRLLVERSWITEELRTNLWLVPGVLVLAAIVLFLVTYGYDREVYLNSWYVPRWINTGGADAARQVLIALAAAVITVVGVVFSVTIVALTLASSQFGPRMLRNFIRDRGTQVTLGAFVATFVYLILVLGSIGADGHGEFVPHLSVAVGLLLVLGDLLVLIYFIHHVATSIQLPWVIAGIAADLHQAVELELPTGDDAFVSGADPTDDAALARAEVGVEVPASTSGYLQYVSQRRLVKVAARHQAVVEVIHRPGHFVSAGRPLARVAPAEAAPFVAEELRRSHVTGAQRTLPQDLAFAIDQLVEIAIRALSPAVNDTFTALSCIDWLGDGLAVISRRWVSDRRAFRDDDGQVRLIEAGISYQRLVDRAYDKIRQAGRGMPAVMIRQLDSLRRLVEATDRPDHLAMLGEQADMILRGCEALPEAGDRADVQVRYDRFRVTLDAALAG